jgi:hypothetical protein
MFVVIEPGGLHGPLAISIVRAAESSLRTNNIGLAAATCAVVVLSATACGSSSSKSSSTAANAPGSATSAAPAPTTPTTTEIAPSPLSDDELQAALLLPSGWGSGWKHADDRWPLTQNSGLGEVDQIASSDCWTVINGDGTRIGSLSAARDLVIGTNDDLAHQDAYQFGMGDAATMMGDFAKKVDDCATFTHTPKDNSTTYTVKASQQSVSGLGDQAVKTTVYDDSPKWGKDVSIQLDVRYGDVVISVMYDSTNSSRALGYDVAAKVKAIAAKLNLKATGS